MNLIAKTLQGLEEVLAKELTQLGANDIQIGNRMVSFTGDQAMLYRANFCLRTALRILVPIKQFKANDPDQVYEQVKNMPWEDYIDENSTFLVDSVVFSEDFRHSKFVAYRVKDAIADRFREKTGNRPNVAIANPDLRINVHIADHDVTISLDSSGESLHKRGYKVANVPAPINEVLAAGIILLTGWDGECDLIDPFCGSGTILIEAALIARNIYPGVFREQYAFEKWRDYNPELLQQIYEDDSNERPFNHKIYGYDISKPVVAIARENVKSAGLTQEIDITQQDFYEFEWNHPANATHAIIPTDDDDDELNNSETPDLTDSENNRPAIIITNPPYGERLNTPDILQLYATIGSRLKQQFAGNDAWLISMHEECFDQIGFRPSTRIALFNGALPCELRKYQVFTGSMKQQWKQGHDIKTKEDRQRNSRFKPHKTYDGEEPFSNNDDHHFRSLPNKDRGQRPPRRGRDEEFHPLFEGDEPVTINRHNFKWGDRGDNYQPQQRERDRDDRRDGFQKSSFAGSDRPRRDRNDRQQGGRDGDRKNFRGDRNNDRGGNRNNRDRNRDDRNNRDRGNGPRNNRGGNDRGGKPKWGFDAEGRPFRRDDKD